MTRHLHRDYHTAHCGIDASYVMMTFDADEADCASCKAAYDLHVAEEKRLADEAKQRHRDLIRRAQEHIAAKRAADLAREQAATEARKVAAAEQAKRDAEQLTEWVRQSQ